MRRHALVTHIRMPTVDRDAGSLFVDYTIRFLLDAGWRVTFLAGQAPEAVERRHADRLRRMGVETYAGFDWAERILTSADIDLALISYWEPASRLIPVVRQHSPATRVLLNTIDLNFLRDARRSYSRRDALDSAYGGSVAKELNTYAQADALLTVSDKERDLLDDFLGQQAFTLPLVEDVPRSPHPVGARRGMMFVGNFRHLPNREAVEHLCGEVLPLVDKALLERHPLTVLGSWLDQARLDVDPASPGVNLVGWVPSVRPYLERARISVVPLLHGAGVKGKVIQSMMAHTPVVTTPIGAEGLDLVQGEHALIGADAADLAAGITRTLTDDALWERLARQGADHVDARHRPAVLGPRFIEIVDAVMAGPHGGGSGRSNGRDRATPEQVLAERVRTIASPGDVVLVPVGGGAVPDLTPQRAWPFPQARDGSPGGDPPDSAAAINHLEAQRQQGARWFALPSSASSWRHRYPELLDHLETRHRRLHHDEHLALYELDGRRPGAAANVEPHASVHVLGTYASERTGPSPTLLAGLQGSGGLVVTQSWRSSAEPAWSIPGDAPDADYVVLVDDRAVLPARFLAELITAQDALRVDRLQPAHHAGPTAGPPVTERHRGVVARELAAVTPLPVVSVRRGADPAGPVALSDEVTIGLRSPVPRVLAGEAADVHRVWVRDDRGDVVAVDRPPPDGAPRISVLIATHDRPELLRACLGSFAEQTLDRSDFEVVLVDDGSRAPVVPDVVDELAGRLSIVGVRIRHAGRSAAKNLAVMLARAPVVLFFDDDDRAAPDYLERHVAGHEARPGEAVAVLGHTNWAPELTRSPLMHYVTDVDRMLFAYERLRDGQVLDWHGFWEGRVSCKRSLLLRHGLHDQRLVYSIDSELAWRLRGTGLRIVYDAAAVSLMARAIDVDTFGARSQAKGRAHAMVAALHPGTEIATRLVPAGTADLWRAKQHVVGPLRRRIAELEASAADDEVQPELHAAYRELFRILHAKGVATVADPGGEPAADGAGSGTLAPTPTPGGGPGPELVHDGTPDDAGRPPQLSVTVPVWSRTPELADMARRTIERVWEVARVPTEVVVVDNGSPVETPLAARVHRYAENRGVSVGWNTGIRLSSAPVIAVLNSDCLVEPGWDEALLAAATDGRRIAFPYTDHCDGQGFTRPDQAGTAGWCFALARELYDEIGPFDEWFSPAFCEDTDYWHRAWKLGVELSPVPAARVVHARRTSSHPEADRLLKAHRYKYGWKHGVDPDRAPPYYNREVVDYEPKPKWMRVRPGPDRPRVFCIGLNKTGTSSFHAAMEILGFTSLHWGGPATNAAVRAALDEGRPLLSGIDPAFDAFSDIGLLSTHFKELDEQYPGSRFVLSVRPVDEWIDSRRRHVERNLARRSAGTYHGDFLVVDEDLWREQWERQVGRARRHFAGRPEFLEVDFTAGGGWRPLCELLDVPVPTARFPWENRDRALRSARD
jgi:glycosyltransferase involved in cell wall biosynthesis